MPDPMKNAGREFLTFPILPEADPSADRQAVHKKFLMSELAKVGSGAKGDTGVAGDKGDTGSASTVPGPQGDTGADGAKGDTGSGAPGAQGDTGANGASGPQGDTGVPGVSGVDGASGPQGDTGAPGEMGNIGPQGDTGPAGASGVAGASGPKGDTGADGASGASGAQGAKGDTGSAGESGAAGAKGDTGTAGAAGSQGDTGVGIVFDQTLSSDHSYSGQTTTEAVGESVAFGDLLYFNWTDKEFKKAEPTGAGSANTMPVSAIALESKSDGQTCLLLRRGFIRDDSWTLGAAIVMAGASAAPTTTILATATNQVQRIGIAIAASKMWFDPNPTVVEVP